MKYIAIIITVAYAILLTSCGGNTSKGDQEKPQDHADERPFEGGVTPKEDQEKPLNISIYLDLSDRIERDLTPSQLYRDTALINMIIDKFIKQCVDDHIIKTKHRIKIFFYPTPKNPGIVEWASNMEVDMGALKPADKKVVLNAMKDQFDEALSHIYSETLANKNWVGSDIWGFFSDKRVDELCIKDGYRNILVILTDGYIYDVNNKRQEGKAYSYVLPQTLSVEGSSLISKRKGLGDLDVLMLEVNPYVQSQKDKLLSVLQNWFNSMEIGNLKIVETDLPTNTKIYIDNFFKGTK